MSKRVAIYARYSSDRQKATSLDDQISMAQKFCADRGWRVVHVFTDKEKTGRNTRRPGFQAMKAAVEAGEVDIVVIEAIDRLTRKIADALNHFDLFRFQNAELYSVTEGQQDFFKVLLAGLGAQLFAEMVGQHSKRTMKGGIERHRLHTSAYGYRKLAVEEGLNREIDPDKAAIVRRIFEEFSEGKSSKKIAEGLNADRVPAPKGGTWEPSTIRGHAARGEGILHNRLYVGRARVCATTRSYHPETGTKRTILTPQDEVEVEIPQLRIVPQALWDAVHEELDRRSSQRTIASNPSGARRSQHLFSGLLVCGCCGAPYVKHNRTSFQCREAIKRVCRDAVPISQKRIEARVFGCLREAFLSPEFIARFESAVAAEREKLGSSDIESEIAGLKAARADARSRLTEIMSSIEQGAPYHLFKARTEELDAEITEIEDRLARAKARLVARDAVQVDIAQVYADVVHQMETLLGDPDLVEQARGFLGMLVHRIVLTPDSAAKHGVAAVIETDLGSLVSAGARDDDRETIAQRVTRIPC